MAAGTAKTQWKVLMAIMAFCGMFWLTVACGGLWAARAFSPALAESLSFWALGAGRTRRGDVSLPRGATAILNDTLAATDKDALFEWLDDLHDQNTPAQEDLVKSGRVVVLTDGAPVRVLGSDRSAGAGTLARVRILEGRHAGKAVWVPMEWLEGTRP